MNQRDRERERREIECEKQRNNHRETEKGGERIERYVCEEAVK